MTKIDLLSANNVEEKKWTWHHSQALDVYFSGWMERISVRIIWTVEELQGVHFTKEGEVGGHNRNYTNKHEFVVPAVVAR